MYKRTYTTDSGSTVRAPAISNARIALTKLGSTQQEGSPTVVRLHLPSASGYPAVIFCLLRIKKILLQHLSSVGGPSSMQNDAGQRMRSICARTGMPLYRSIITIQNTALFETGKLSWIRCIEHSLG